MFTVVVWKHCFVSIENKLILPNEKGNLYRRSDVWIESWRRWEGSSGRRNKDGTMCTFDRWWAVHIKRENKKEEGCHLKGRMGSILDM